MYAHNLADIIIVRCLRQCHMPHCTPQIDLHARMQQKAFISSHHHHVDAKRPDIATQAEQSANLLLNGLQQNRWNITCYHFVLPGFCSYYIADIGTVLRMKKG